MNIKQLQLNLQWQAALLLAGLILVLAAGLTWVDIRASTLQPAKMIGDGIYSPYLDSTGSSAGLDCPVTVKGSKPGGTTDGISSRGCESDLLVGSKKGASGAPGFIV